MSKRVYEVTIVEICSEHRCYTYRVVAANQQDAERQTIEILDAPDSPKRRAFVETGVAHDDVHDTTSYAIEETREVKP